MLDLQSEEILYSNNELEKKFRDLETKIEQLSLLSDLSAAVNATDVSQTKARSGQTLDATNFRSDVTVNGTISAADLALVKSRSGG